jgi:hypothetical protein
MRLYGAQKYMNTKQKIKKRQARSNGMLIVREKPVYPGCLLFINFITAGP